MGKSAKFISVFLVAMIVLSIGGFFASYRHGKKNSDQTRSSSLSGTPGQVDTTEKTNQSKQTTSEKTIMETTLTSTKKTEDKSTKSDSTPAGTTLKTGYPFDYAGINPVLTNTAPENWNLILVNADYYLPESYKPKLAIAVEGYEAKLDAGAAVYYKKMFAAAKQDGLTLSPTSVNGGYRSLATQKRLFEDKIARYGKASNAEAVRRAALINQPPGCSEHNVGLAMDIKTTSNFESTREFKWLSEHAADYGFIMRYPESKSAITGVMYEPWHWRFVGPDHAKAIKASGLCFEEYLKTL